MQWPSRHHFAPPIFELSRRKPDFFFYFKNSLPPLVSFLTLKSDNSSFRRQKHPKSHQKLGLSLVAKLPDLHSNKNIFFLFSPTLFCFISFPKHLPWARVRSPSAGAGSAVIWCLTSGFLLSSRTSIKRSLMTSRPSSWCYQSESSCNIALFVFADGLCSVHHNKSVQIITRQHPLVFCQSLIRPDMIELNRGADRVYSVWISFQWHLH